MSDFQIMSESVACALEVLDSDSTQQTRVFIRMIDRYFDCLNVKSPMTGQLKRKENLLPYKSVKDEQFKVCTTSKWYYTCPLKFLLTHLYTVAS